MHNNLKQIDAFRRSQRKNTRRLIDLGWSGFIYDPDTDSLCIWIEEAGAEARLREEFGEALREIPHRFEVNIGVPLDAEAAQAIPV